MRAGAGAGAGAALRNGNFLITDSLKDFHLSARTWRKSTISYQNSNQPQI